MSAQAVAADAQPRAVRVEPASRPVLDGSEEQAIRGARAARAPKPVPDARRTLRTLWSRIDSRALRTHFGTFAGVAILGVLVWRMGTGVVVDGLRRVDGPTVLAALGIGVVTTVFSAWRWCLVARGLKIRLPLGPAVADYYRSLFLNAALPGGVLGDVHRAVRHGQSAGDLGRGVRAVVLERVAGQVALMAVGGVLLLTLPSPVQAQTQHLVEASAIALALAAMIAAVVAVRLKGSSPSSRRMPRLRNALAEAREGLVARHTWPGVVVSSAVVLAGHLVMFVLAARVAGADASPVVLLPLAVLALLAMGLPLNVGGWGPREGATAWAFGAAGLGASTGLSVAVVYGVLSLVASLPGIGVLVARWAMSLRRPRPAYEKGAPQRHNGHVPRSPPANAGDAADGQGRLLSAPSCPAPFCMASTAPGAEFAASGLRIEKYEPKQSTRPASSSLPFAAVASEGRPMTPDSV
ncbi:lysylphosphatidylglycerol synthase transmembrane domain-containing protein [Streptomyces pseudoechinosporeus]